MAAPFGSESMGNWQENRLIHRFENHPQNFLYQLICECRDSQRSLFLGIVLLLDIGVVPCKCSRKIPKNLLN